MEICLLLSLFDLDAFTVECVASKTVSQFLHLWEKEVIFKCPGFPFVRRGRVLVSHSWQRGYFEVFWFTIHDKEVILKCSGFHSWQRGYFEVFWIPFMTKRLFWSVPDSIHEKEVILKCSGFHSWERGYFEVFWIPFMRKRLFSSVLVSHSWEKGCCFFKCTGFPFMRKRLFWSVLVSHSWERGSLWSIPVEKEAHSEHCFPAPSSKPARFSYTTEGALFICAAVQQCGQRPPKGSGTNIIVEATWRPSMHVNARCIHPG